MGSDPGVTTHDILGGTDGPHRDAAEDFLHALICETCWAEPADDTIEHLGLDCLAET